MSDAFHPDHTKGGTRQGSAGLDTFVQTQNLREMIDRIKYGRFSSLEDYERAAIIFQDDCKHMAYLGGISRMRYLGMSPTNAPPARDKLNRLLDLGLKDLAQSGHTDLGPIGLMLGQPVKGPGIDIHYFGETPDKMTMLVSKVNIKRVGGYDILLIGPRGVGKTNTGNNYMELPWMREYDLPVISAVPIENACDFNQNKKLFQDFPYKSQAITAICDIRLKDIAEGTETGILSFNDESGILAGRSKTQSDMVHNQTVFCYISRHFRVTSVWTYQLPQDVPNKILDLSTERIFVDSWDTVRMSVKASHNREITHKFYGFEGWQTLKKHGKPGQYIEYKDDTPSTQMWNVDVLELLAIVNRAMANYSEDAAKKNKDEKLEKEKQFYTNVRRYSVGIDLYGPSVDKTKKQFLKSAAITFGVINGKIFFGGDGEVFIDDSNLKARFVDRETGAKFTGAEFAHLLGPLGLTPSALGQMMHGIYREIEKNPGMFKATSDLSNEEETAIDAVAERLGLGDAMEEEAEV